MTTYSNPPIQEALIDIKVEFPEELDLKLVEALHQDLIEDFPEKLAQSSVVFQINSDGSSIDENHVEGYLLRAADGSKVIQLGREGFTFSLIGNYSTYEVFIKEAMVYWAMFLKATSPVAIKRMGVRYINRIDVPDGRAPGEYFTTKVDLGSIDAMPSEIFLRAVLPFEGHTAIITEATNANLRTNDGQSFIMDIDVFSEQRLKADDDAGVQGSLATLRVTKNSIFESSLTEAAKGLFR